MQSYFVGSAAAPGDPLNSFATSPPQFVQSPVPNVFAARKLTADSGGFVNAPFSVAVADFDNDGVHVCQTPRLIIARCWVRIRARKPLKLALCMRR